MSIRCSDEKIDAYLLHRLTEDEARAFEEHYFNCAACFEAVVERERLIAVIKSRGPELFGAFREAPAAARPRSPKSREFLAPSRWVFVSLSVLAVMAIVFGLMPRSRPAPPRFVLDGEEVLRGETVTLISPVIDIAAAPPVFEWKSLPGVAEYKVALYADALLWSQATTGTELVLPEEVRAQLIPGQKYSWQVKAFSAQGQLISVSSRLHFTIKPPASN